MFFFLQVPFCNDRCLRIRRCYYSLSAMELYELSMMQLRHTQNILGASQCLLFLTSGNNLLVRFCVTIRIARVKSTRTVLQLKRCC